MKDWYRESGHPEPKKRHETSGLRTWKKRVLERDGHMCVKCGAIEHLHVDHIQPYAIYEEKRLDVDNGRVLCRQCHYQTDSFGRKAVIMRRNLAINQPR